MSQRSSGSKRQRGSDEPSGSQTSTASVTLSGLSQKSGLSQTQIKSLVSDVISFILVAGSKKGTIKREAIRVNVLKEHAKLFPEIIHLVKEKLAKAYGFQLLELSNDKNQFLLVNIHKIEGDKSHIQNSNSEFAEHGLLFIILAIIFMNDNRISENSLWQALAKLGVSNESTHSVFGNVTKLITESFVKDLYLLHIVIPNSQPPAYEFTWGPRATAEISKKDILQFVCDVFGNIDPKQFTTQNAEATEESRPKN